MFTERTGWSLLLDSYCFNKICSCQSTVFESRLSQEDNLSLGMFHVGGGVVMLRFAHTTCIVQRIYLDFRSKRYGSISSLLLD